MTTTTTYREADADLRVLDGKTIAVIGYGNQGRSQALNLRDSGLSVLIGNIPDAYRERALADGFAVHAIHDAVRQADVTMILLPDEIAPEVYDHEIGPMLRPGSAVCFASGYTVAFGLIKPDPGLDLILLAPRMVGPGVRDLYLDGTGYFSFVAVEHDATGQALPILLALCHGVGTLKRGAVRISFRMEAELDLFNEQAFGPAFGKVLLAAVDTLVAAGYPREAVLLEIYLSGELGYICQRMADEGLIKQLDDHSQTSQYGAISRGIQFLLVNIARPMRRVLANIRQGGFAREWAFEQKSGKLRYRFLKAMALRQPINRLEREVRSRLGLSS